MSRAADRIFLFFFSSRRRHTRSYGDWGSDVCSSDLAVHDAGPFAKKSFYRGRLLPLFFEGLAKVGQAFQPDSAGGKGSQGSQGSQESQARKRSEERRVGKEGMDGWQGRDGRGEG